LGAIENPWSLSDEINGKTTVNLRYSVAGNEITVETPSKSPVDAHNLLIPGELAGETGATWEKVGQSRKIAGEIGGKV
jgi:hypothetical protein